MDDEKIAKLVNDKKFICAVDDSMPCGTLSTEFSRKALLECLDEQGFEVNKINENPE